MGWGTISWLTRQHERPDVGAGEFVSRLEEKRERIAGLLGQHDRVHKAARGGESGVELMLVVRTHRVDGGGIFGLCRVIPEDGLDRRLAFHDAHPSGWPRHDEIWIATLPGHGAFTLSRGMVLVQSVFR